MAEHRCTKEKVFTELFVRQESIQKDVAYIRKLLEDNGNPGMITKSNETHDYIVAQKQKEDSEDRLEKWTRRKLFFWGTALLILIQIISELIKHKMFGG